MWIPSFIVGNKDSDGDGLNDLEDFTVHVQAPWQVGAADSGDWANPGHQTLK